MGNWIYQINCFLQLTSPLGEDELILTNLTGVEDLSSPFKFSLQLISGKLNIQSNQLLGKILSVIQGST